VYRLEVSQTAHRQILKLPVKTQERVNKAIAGLANDPRPAGSKKLTNREGYRVRVGDYRILYSVDDATKTAVIYRVMSRGDVYRLR
jgi:mRNA interferase RelE/StbE